MALKTLALLAAAAVARADWTVVAPNVGTIATGVDFTSATQGFLPVAQNGVGTAVLRSTDGGKTWGNPATEPFALLLLDITAFGDNVAVIGALEMLYSTDAGATFNSSLVSPGAGQCIRNIGPAGQEIGFGAAGEFGLLSENNGVAVSYDAGAIYKAIDATGVGASARYAAFPSDKTWYLAAGDWPGEGSDDDPPTDDDPPSAALGWVVNPAHYIAGEDIPRGSRLVKKTSARIHLLQEPSGAVRYAFVKREAMPAANWGRNLGNTSTWDAQIALTTDGGNTWDVVFSRTGQFYMNGIECTTEQACCAVAETGAGGSVGGSFIWCTQDGGQTWNETLIDSDPNSSLIDISSLSATEFWAVGGEFGVFGPTASHFVHTTDGGLTWTIETPNAIVDQYAIAIDCVPAANNCWSPLLDILTQETSIAALNAPPSA